MKQYCRKHSVDFGALERRDRFPRVERLCNRLMADIAAVVPILPVSLVATVLLEHADIGLDIRAVEEMATRVQERLQANGAPVIEMSRTSRSGVITHTLDFLFLRRVITIMDEKIRIVDGEAQLLHYYANAIAHWLKK